MRASLNVNSIKKTDTINLSVNPVTNVSVNTPTDKTTNQEENPYGNLSVSNEPSNTPASTTQYRNVAYEDWEAIVAENKALKLVIDILNNNPLIVNKYIIADDETLKDLIKTLTQSEEVQIDADDLAQGCLSSKTYRKVHNVFIIKNNSTLNLKYDFPAVLKLLLDLKISIKYVY